MSKLLNKLIVLLVIFAMIVSAAVIPENFHVHAENIGTVEGEKVVTYLNNDKLTRKNNFNDQWKFYLGTSNNAQTKNFDDSSWKQVTLPHDYSITQDFTASGEAESGFLPGGTGWYRKSFTLPKEEAGKKFVINFDGVYKDATVYINGTKVGENHYGYSNFAFDITDHVVCDGVTNNVIAVKVEHQTPSSRWYSGSGIYRDVTLIVTNPIHVALNGTYVTTPDIATGSGKTQIQVEVQNETNENMEVTVKNTIYDANGNAVSSTVESNTTINANSVTTVNANATVNNPTLWSLNTPYQYTVKTEVYSEGTLVDSYDTQFGYRWYRFDKTNGFYLNGQAVKLNGVCMHHDQGAAGSAAYYDAMYRQLKSMKDMGANAIRITHNPGDEDFIKICNELGLLVIEELFDGWTYAKNGNTYDFSKYFNVNLTSDNQVIDGNSSLTWSEFVARSIAKRDRNAPSLIAYSLCNEVQEGGSSDSTYGSIAQKLINAIKVNDTSRTYTIGDNTRSTSASGNIGNVLKVIQDNGGVLGFNYGSDPYSSLNSAWTAPIYASETSSAVNSRGVYSTQANNTLDSSYHLTSYDTSTVGWGATAHDSMYRVLTKDYVAGEFVWTGWDYIGEPTPKNGTGSGSVTGAGAIPNSSYFGIVDTAGFEKDTYYLYQAQWKQDSTTLHLVTAWDNNNMLTTSNKTPVVIYSNAPVIKLYRNGSLIGTATRVVNTTNAGHIYYTYTTSSNDSSICNAVSASGSSSLYATFNVTYAEGTISAIAYQADGTTEITNTTGTKVVTTPGAVNTLSVVQNKTQVNADGQSLVYVEVSMEDASGNLSTTASNTINFELVGNGTIVGVDNGDQATVNKFQQSSVMDSETRAHIQAYAGKALVIIRSTKDAGDITLNISSSGCTSKSITINTLPVEQNQTTGIASYEMVKDYTVQCGVQPTFNSVASVAYADGSTKKATVEWDTVTQETYNTPGDYEINGLLKVSGEEDITVKGNLHVIANVIAMQNISTVTTPNTIPTLPNTVRGIMANGTLTGEFNVTWVLPQSSQFATVDDIVTIHGTASVIGDLTLPVTCTVRVGEAINTESTNVAPNASSITQNIPDTNQSDVLDSINNSYKEFVDDNNERWTNWKNRTNSDFATLTFNWDTAQLLSSVNLYYYYDNCCAKPENVVFEYSLDGNTFTTIDAVETLITTGTHGEAYAYEFSNVINPVAVRITLTQQGGTTGAHCVGLIEAEMMTFAGQVEINNSCDLDAILVNGSAIESFDANKTIYTASSNQITATTEVNAGITILPEYEGVVRILTVSEDGNATKTYEVQLKEACNHENTIVRNQREAACTVEGYTGDVYCTNCNELITKGEIIPATGHSIVIQNAKEATCIEDGYTGDQFCTVEKAIVVAGSVIKATGHSYNNGVVTKAATCKETGVKTYTCTTCGDSYQVSIPQLAHQWDNGVVVKQATDTEDGQMKYTCSLCGEERFEVIPHVKVVKLPIGSQLRINAKRGNENNSITLTGTFLDYQNISDYEITGQGIIYIKSSSLGAKCLTASTSGRTNVKFSSMKADGTFSYTMKATSASTKYVVRSYVTYIDSKGNTVYIYSAPISVYYSNLK